MAISSSPARGRRARPARRGSRGRRRTRGCAAAPLEFAVELLESRAPGPHVRFELARLLVVEVERRAAGTRPRAWPARRAPVLAGARGSRAGPSPRARRASELVDGERCQLLSAWLELRQKVGDIAGRGCEKPALDRLTGHAALGIGEGRAPAGRVSSPPLRGHRPAAARSLRGLDPARREWHELLVQALCSPPVEREAAEQEHTRDRVGRLREAGAREVVVDEALGAEAGEQPLGDALLQVEVDGVLGQDPGVLEDDRADRRLPAPVGELLILLPGSAERVERGGPARVGAARRSSGGKVQTRRPSLVGRLDERLGTQELKGAGERIAEGRRLEADPGRVRPRAGSGIARSAPSAPPGVRARPRAPPR